jgi:hypothetical protein
VEILGSLESQRWDGSGQNLSLQPVVLLQIEKNIHQIVGIDGCHLSSFPNHQHQHWCQQYKELTFSPLPLHFQLLV